MLSNIQNGIINDEGISHTSCDPVTLSRDIAPTDVETNFQTSREWVRGTVKKKDTNFKPWSLLELLGAYLKCLYEIQIFLRLNYITYDNKL